MHKSITVVLLAAAALAASNTFAQQPASPPAATPSSRAEIEAEMRTLQERLAVLSREYATLRLPAPTVSATVSAVTGGDIESMELTLPRLEAERDRLRQTFTEEHPQLRALEMLIQVRRSEIAARRVAEARRAAEAQFGPPAGDTAPELDSAAPSTAPRDVVVAPPGPSAPPRPASIEQLDEAVREAREAREARAEAVQDEVRRLRSDASASQEEQRRRAAELAVQLEQQRLQAAELDARALALSEGLGSLFGNTLRYSTTVWDTMQLVTLTPQLGEYFGTESGILVLRAPADESLGLRDGDVILDIGGRTPTSPEHTLRILSSFVPGETLRLAIMRNGRPETHEIVLPQDEVAAARQPSRAQPPQVRPPSQAPQQPQPSQRPQQRQPAQEEAAPADADGAIR